MGWAAASLTYTSTAPPGRKVMSFLLYLKIILTN